MIVDVPAGADAGDAGADVALDLFRFLVGRTAGVSGLVDDLLGRPTRARLVARGQLDRVRPPGLRRLQTTGPVQHRLVVLEDGLAPHLPVAVQWSLIVAWRLPAGAQDALGRTEDALDRVLDRYAEPWCARPVEVATFPADEASVRFAWAAAGAPLVEQARLLVHGGNPVAITVEEIPFLAPRTDPAAPLRPREHSDEGSGPTSK